MKTNILMNTYKVDIKETSAYSFKYPLSSHTQEAGNNEGERLVRAEVLTERKGGTIKE